MIYVSEKYQLGILIDYLDRQGFDYVREGMLYGISIDTIGYNGDSVYTFECKTKDFKRGIYQATRNLDFADHSYLVVWENRLSERLADRIKDEDIGLISVDNEANVIVEAPENSPNNFAREEAKKLITEHV